VVAARPEGDAAGFGADQGKSLGRRDTVRRVSVDLEVQILIVLTSNDRVAELSPGEGVPLPGRPASASCCPPETGAGFFGGFQSLSKVRGVAQVETWPGFA
jgi:hypothetical protein